MKRNVALLAFISVTLLSSCAKKEVAESPQPATEPAQAAPPTAGPNAVVHLKNGSKVPGSIVASSRTEMVIAGADGIETKIPLTQVKSVEYVEGGTPQASGPVAQAKRLDREVQPRKEVARSSPPAQREAQSEAPKRPAESVLSPSTPPPSPAVTTKTYEVAAGSEISVRTNEAIDSETAAEGQTFDAQVTRDVKDANGDVVIPRRSDAKVIIRSASKGGRIRGASDLVLDLQSVSINGKQYTIDTIDVTRKGKAGVGANRRTAEYTGGGAALGAIIGAIAGGGKGAAIGAGAGAGAGALTQILTKGRSIKVPAESVLTFSLDKPLRVVAAQ